MIRPLNMILFAVNFDSPADIIQNTKDISAEVDTGIAVLWDFLKSPLFLRVSNVGALVAALGIGFWIIKWIKDVAKSDEFFISDKMPQIAFGLLLAVLLGAPTDRGKLLSDVLVGFDRVSSNLSNTVLVAARSDPEEDPVASVQVRQAVVERATQDAKACEEFPLVSPERTSCIGEAIERLQASLDNYKDEEWAKSLENRWVRYLAGLTNDSIGQYGQARSTRDVQAAREFLESGLNKALVGITFAFAVVWLLLLRIAKPLISVIFPLYIGLSFIPSSNPPVVKAIGLLMDAVVIEIVFKILLSMVAQLALAMPLELSSLVIGLLLTFGGIPLSVVLGKLMSNGLTGAGLAAIPFLARGRR